MDRRNFIRSGLLVAGGGLLIPEEIGKRILEKTQFGIYNLEEDSIHTEENAVVFVHPYFIPRDWNPEYFSHLEDFFQNYHGPIIALEEHDKIRETGRRILNLGRKNATFIIPTDKMNPSPSELTWNEFATFLTSFDINPLKIGGGYYGGCLEETRRQLHDRNIQTEVLEEMTFSRYM